MKNHVLKLFVALVLGASVVGCKMQIQVPPGGQVLDSAGTVVCDEHQFCNIDIVDLHFDETFTAVPKPGFTFHGWKKRARGLYGGVKSDTVRIATAALEGHPELIELLESDIEYYLEPDFARNHHLHRHR